MSKLNRRKKNREDSLLESLERRQLLSVQSTIAASDVVVDGGTSYEFAAIFTSGAGIDPATIKPGDVTVSGPSGTIAASVVKVNPSGEPSLSVTAIFDITPPGGKWEMADNGTYNVDVAADSIVDTSGSAAPAGSIGSFQVNIQPSVIVNDNTLVVNGTAQPDTISISRPDINLLVTEDGVSTMYDGDTIDKISVIGGTASESVTLNDSTNATILGTHGNDTILVTGSGRDFLSGLAGDDSIEGGTGNCSLKGAGGNDTLIGGRGDDSIRGGGGENLLQGAGGNDTLAGGHGDDSIKGGAGNNIVYALLGSATINGGTGSDTVHADATDDVLSATLILNS